VKRTLAGVIAVSLVLGAGAAAIATQPQWAAQAELNVQSETPGPEPDGLAEGAEGLRPGAQDEEILVELEYRGAADLSAFADEDGNVRLTDLPWYQSGEVAPAYATPGGKTLIAAFEASGYRVLVSETIEKSDGLPHERAAFAAPDGTVIQVFSSLLNGQPAVFATGAEIQRLADGSDVATKVQRTFSSATLVSDGRQVVVIAFAGPSTPESARMTATDLIELAQRARIGF